ncbi:helix-turn-helix domain-containing protein [Streptomyces syringium]|uniref:helix-turn-helix domain-containing protein n=1 Tax=Streptomyces syringium TaxID=76729 RepID=UPI0034293755
MPVAVLADRRVLGALSSRDFGALFAAVNASGVSFNKIAEACGLKPERVSRLARGDGEVTSLPVIERIADGLRIPGALLGLAERPWESGPSSTVNGDDPMKRRMILRSALAAGLASAGMSALSETRRVVDMTLTGSTADIGLWESAAEQYGFGYHGQPPAERLADLAADFHSMGSLLDLPLTVPDRTRLCRATAQLAGMTAIVLHDLGDRSESTAWFRTAGRAAEESGDRVLHAWVLARHAMVPLHLGAPQAAADIAEKARATAGERPSAAAALAAVVAARAHALLHRPGKAHAALADADRFSSGLAGEQRADTWFGYCEEKHHIHLSQALTHLGETRRAFASQERALELCSPSSRMAPALLRLDRALCLSKEGEVEGACGTAAGVLRGLPSEHRRGLTLIRAKEVYRSVPSQQRRLVVVRDLGDMLRAA